jgi:hypothetical protein
MCLAASMTSHHFSARQHVKIQSARKVQLEVARLGISLLIKRRIVMTVKLLTDIRRSSCCGILAILTYGPTDAASLQDYQAAWDRGGVCSSILSSNLQSQCQSYDREVGDYCKGGKGPYSCKDFSPEKLINTYKAAKEDFGRTSDTAKRDDLKKQMDAAEKDIRSLKEKIAPRLDTAQRCYKARGYLDDVFKQAIDDAQYDINRDPTVVPIATKLKAKWEASRQDHKDTEQQYLNAVKTCAGYMDMNP